jgi:CRP-like cAMP-binding protein
MLFPKKQAVFAQGDPADAVFYLQAGKVRLTVVSKTGKEAAIGISSGEVSSVKVRLRVNLSVWALRPQ